MKDIEDISGQVLYAVEVVVSQKATLLCRRVVWRMLSLWVRVVRRSPWLIFAAYCSRNAAGWVAWQAGLHTLPLLPAPNVSAALALRLANRKATLTTTMQIP